MSDISQGELLRYMERQDKLMSEIISEQKLMGETLSANTVILKNINEQTTKTNGRVNKLEAQKEEDEKRFDSIEKKQVYVIGFVAGISLIGGITWAIVTWIIPNPTETVSEETFSTVYQAFIKSKEYEEAKNQD